MASRRLREAAKRAVTRAVPPVGRLVAERDALRADVARLRRRARQSGTPYDGRYVFVMTYGRSGSTLLQAVLNATPGVLIRGENRAIPYHLFEYHQRAVREAERVGRGAHRRVAPFFGIGDYPTELALTRMRQLMLDTLLRPEPGTRVLGFKEIRWYQDDVDEYVGFLREVFPGARFIVNTRRLEDVARSAWWADRSDSLDRLRAIEERILTVAETLGPAAHRVRYDDYVRSPEQLAPLYAWLQLPFDEARVRKVIERRTYAQIASATNAGTNAPSATTERQADAEEGIA